MEGKINVLNWLKVKRAHLDFDLEKFMKRKSLSDGAIALITPSQFIIADCLKLDSVYGCHANAADVIYNVIYSGFKRVSFYYAYNWQNSIATDGNICIQLCNSNEFYNFISVPTVISEKQYNALLCFFNQLRDSVLNSGSYFENNLMKFLVFDMPNDEYSIDNIDLFLKKLKKRVGFVALEKEVIIGDDITRLDYVVIESRRIVKRILK